MCGLVGLSISRWHAGLSSSVEAMANSLRHRGPDDAGILECPANGVALGHRRLSIIDLSQASHQPMVDNLSGVVFFFRRFD